MFGERNCRKLVVSVLIGGVIGVVCCSLVRAAPPRASERRSASAVQPDVLMPATVRATLTERVAVENAGVLGMSGQPARLVPVRADRVGQGQHETAINPDRGAPGTVEPVHSGDMADAPGESRLDIYVNGNKLDGSRSAGYHPPDSERDQGSEYDDWNGEVDTDGSDAVISWGSFGGWAVWYVAIGEQQVRDGSLIIRVRFKDTGFWGLCHGPEIYVRNFDTNQWHMLCEACGENDEFVTYEYVPSTSNRFVSDFDQIWIRVNSGGPCHTVVDWVEVQWEGADEELAYIDDQGEDDCPDDGSFDGVSVTLDVNTGNPGDGTTVDIEAEARLRYRPNGQVVDSDSDTWTITDWEEEYRTLIVSACDGDEEGMYDLEIEIRDASGNPEDEYEVGYELHPNPPLPPPDLRVQSSDLYPRQDISGGDSIYNMLRVVNQGDGPSPAFDTMWYISTNEDVTTSDRAWVECSFSCCLEPGSTATCEGNNPWPQEAAYTIPGATYWVAAKVDHGNEVAESNENNNWSQTFTVVIEEAPPEPPDLRIQSSSRTPATVCPGDQVHMEDVVVNSGDGPTTVTSIARWYISPDSNVTTSDYAWVQHDIPAYLPPGGTQPAQGDWAWPDDFSTPGHTYYIAVKADAAEDQEESNEGNNWGSPHGVTIESGCGTPDLRITASSRSPATGVLPGGDIQLDATVHNNGDGPAGYFFVQWYISLDSTVNESDEPWAEYPLVENLAVGQSRELSGYAVWPDQPPFNEPGRTYWIRVKADVDDDIDELNENNNWGADTWAVTLGEPEQWPDLVIESSHLTPDSGIAPGDPIDLAHTVLNQGNRDATWYFWTTWFISTDSNFDPSSDYAWADAFSPCCLPVGGTHPAGGEVAWPNVAPYNIPGETYYVAVMADDDNRVSESDETNNWSTTYTVMLGDAAVASITGRVRDAQSHATLNGVTVTLTGGGQSTETTTTNSYGEFAFSDLVPVDRTLSLEKSGYFEVSGIAVDLEPNSNADLPNLEMEPVPAGNNPLVGPVQGRYCNGGQHTYYLAGVWLEERFTVSVDWNGHAAGQVEFRTPGGTYQGTHAGGNTWHCDFQMATQFDPGDTLTVVAVPAGGTPTSNQSVANFTVIPAPTGMLPIFLEATPSGAILRYTALSITGDDSISIAEGASVIPEDIPLFGGEDFEFGASFQADATVDVSGDSASGRAEFFTAEGSTEGGTRMAGVSFEINVSAAAIWHWDNASGGWIPGGEIGFGATVEVDVPPTPHYIIFMAGPIPIPVYFQGHIAVGFDNTLQIIPDYSPTSFHQHNACGGGVQA